MCRRGVTDSTLFCFKFQIYLLTKDEGGRTKPVVPFMHLQMFSRTWDCAVQVNIPDKEMIMPGEDAK